MKRMVLMMKKMVPKKKTQDPGAPLGSAHRPYYAHRPALSHGDGSPGTASTFPGSPWHRGFIMEASQSCQGAASCH